ncbi:MAG TPA: FAD/NAD(P)-binding oxidoreductase [Bacteroidales bacterium]|nr:FAD/NAD(P)-binding oxidoreductase [Bacteroidales bacterium]
MGKIVIIGGGTAGTMIANKLYKTLPVHEWEITIVDPDEKHYYQPGFLFIPFNKKLKDKFVKPKKDYIPKGVNFIVDKVSKLEPARKAVLLKSGQELTYDYLIVATGTKPSVDDTPGLNGPLWQKEAFEFYTYEGAVALAEKLETWKGGRMVMAIVDMPIKCPVAPLEFVFLADAFFTQKGIRDKVEISYVTPLPGAFTKPVATAKLSELLSSKNINIIQDFYIEHVDNEGKKLVSYDEKEVPFDLLVTVPLNKGAEFIQNSGIGDDLNYIPVNKETLQMQQYPEIFVLGDAAAIPTSKAGAVAHFAADVLLENLLDMIEGKEPTAKFDGHANCFIETGFGKAALIDFNYDQEPLAGTFPLPVIGPMSLLKETRLNHWGKLAFEWIYWNILIKGRYLPISNKMSMVGKKISK